MASQFNQLGDTSSTRALVRAPRRTVWQRGDMIWIPIMEVGGSGGEGVARRKNLHSVGCRKIKVLTFRPV